MDMSIQDELTQYAQVTGRGSRVEIFDGHARIARSDGSSELVLLDDLILELSRAFEEWRRKQQVAANRRAML